MLLKTFSYICTVCHVCPGGHKTHSYSTNNYKAAFVFFVISRYPARMISRGRQVKSCGQKKKKEIGWVGFAPARA